MQKRPFLWLILLGVALGLGYFLYRSVRPSLGRSTHVLDWLRSPASHPEWAVQAGTRCLPAAPFVFPTNGYIGYLWNDSFRVGHRHQGLDIFAGTGIGVTPVVSAYAGYLTRLPEWKSSVIVRIPSDPLQPGRQIWLYYAHMAAADGQSFISSEFPPGTYEKRVDEGTLLGYQGDYSGDPANPVGVHLHFSIVLDNGQGHFRNELDIKNTLDPSPYFGLDLNAETAGDAIPACNP